MEPQTVTDFSQYLIVYGPLGIFCFYWMVRDWMVTSKIKDTLDKFNTTMTLLCERVEKNG